MWSNANTTTNNLSHRRHENKFHAIHLWHQRGASALLLLLIPAPVIKYNLRSLNYPTIYKLISIMAIIFYPIHKIGLKRSSINTLCSTHSPSVKTWTSESFEENNWRGSKKCTLEKILSTDWNDYCKYEKSKRYSILSKILAGDCINSYKS